MSKGASILVIDDEVQIRRLLKISLEGSGFKFYEAATGSEGLSQIAYCKPDVIILDLNLPDQDGLKLLQALREWCQTPVIVLSVVKNDEDKIALLNAGADDYLIKPFNTRELIARIKVALRHKNPIANDEVFVTGPLKVDLVHRSVRVKNIEIKLTPTEYSILIFLVRNAGKVLTHNQIVKEIWGKQEGVEKSYIRVYINQLRKKLLSGVESTELIQTEPGVGYRLLLSPKE